MTKRFIVTHIGDHEETILRDSAKAGGVFPVIVTDAIASDILVTVLRGGVEAAARERLGIDVGGRQCGKAPSPHRSTELRNEELPALFEATGTQR